MELNPANPNLLGSLALVRGSQGRLEEAVGIRAQLEQAAAHDYVPFGARALANDGCADHDQAYRLLEAALDEHEPMALLFTIARRPEIGSDSRYHALLRRIGLT